MSPHYLNSQWAQWEFRVAQSHAATEKRSRIIVVLYGDIGDINKLEPDIRDYLKLNTYVKWGDKWFWEKFRYAMPHVKGQGPMDKTKSKGLVKTAIKSSIDDKLELIKPVSVTPPQLTTPPAEKIANPLISKLNAKNSANGNGYPNGNGHINGAYVINTSSRQSDV
jgi:protein toll